MERKTGVSIEGNAIQYHPCRQISGDKEESRSSTVATLTLHAHARVVMGVAFSLGVPGLWCICTAVQRLFRTPSHVVYPTTTTTSIQADP